MHEIALYLLAIGGGVLAGFINTLAGSGSLVTLPILMFLGLPSSEANATNRVGVIFQNTVGVWKFHKSGKLVDWAEGFLIWPSILGAVAGAMIAVDLDKKMMDIVIAAVMVLMLFIVVLNPDQWLREQTDKNVKFKKLSTILLFFAIGVYGGFIQAGVGVFLLAAMVMRCGFSMVHANALKLVLVLVFTLPALAVFVYNGQVNFRLGLIMAVGQSVGAWLAAHYAVNSQNAKIWMRRLLILIILLGIAKSLASFFA